MKIKVSMVLKSHNLVLPLRSLTLRNQQQRKRRKVKLHSSSIS